MRETWAMRWADADSASAQAPSSWRAQNLSQGSTSSQPLQPSQHSSSLVPLPAISFISPTTPLPFLIPSLPLFNRPQATPFVQQVDAPQQLHHPSPLSPHVPHRRPPWPTHSPIKSSARRGWNGSPISIPSTSRRSSSVGPASSAPSAPRPTPPIR